MPPYYFIVSAHDTAKILANSPEGTARTYEVSESQEWMKGVTDDPTGENVDTMTLDFLANEVVEAALNGGTLMSVDADSRGALQDIAVRSAVHIQPFN